jgi:hypothetical protein
MSDATFTPGYKFNINACIGRDCKNRDNMCDTCIKFSNYEPNEIDTNGRKKKKQEKAKNVSGADKRRRRKAFTRIKDTLHKGLGSKAYSGIGDGEWGRLHCNICGERVYSMTSEVIYGKIINYCEKIFCRDEIDKMKKGIK